MKGRVEGETSLRRKKGKWVKTEPKGRRERDSELVDDGVLKLLNREEV